MTIESATAALALVGKTVRPAPGSERWARTRKRPRTGIVIDVFIPDIDHPYVVVQYGSDIDYPYPFELEQLAT